MTDLIFGDFSQDPEKKPHAFVKLTMPEGGLEALQRLKDENPLIEVHEERRLRLGRWDIFGKVRRVTGITMSGQDQVILSLQPLPRCACPIELVTCVLPGNCSRCGGPL